MLVSYDLEIGSKGKAAIEKHVRTDKLKFNTRSANSAIRSHFVPKNSALTDKITAAELCKVYHAVQYRYHHSYRSLDCGVKLDQELYAYSSVAKGVTCRRAKAQSLLIMCKCSCLVFIQMS